MRQSVLRDFLLSVIHFFGFSKKRLQTAVRPISCYSLTSFDNRSAAREAAKNNGVAALVIPGGKQKWLILKCPCGCGQEIALNLMSSHLPRWRVDIGSPQRFSVHPSVDATSCGAHFWVRDGRVSWCE
jgi:hypothetical protein